MSTELAKMIEAGSVSGTLMALQLWPSLESWDHKPNVVLTAKKALTGL
jgi:hypothetical protein